MYPSCQSKDKYIIRSEYLSYQETGNVRQRKVFLYHVGLRVGVITSKVKVIVALYPTFAVSVCQHWGNKLVLGDSVLWKPSIIALLLQTTNCNLNILISLFWVDMVLPFHFFKRFPRNDYKENCYQKKFWHSTHLQVLIFLFTYHYIHKITGLTLQSINWRFCQTEIMAILYPDCI